MKKAPATPAVSVISPEAIDTLIRTWCGLGASLSEDQARNLLHAAHAYAQELERLKAMPRVGKTAKDLTHIADLAKWLSETLDNPTRSAIPLLDQAPFHQPKGRCFPPREPLIKTLKQAQKAAIDMRDRLPVDDGSNPVPLYRKLVITAVAIGKENAKPGTRITTAALAKLVNAAIAHGPGKKYAKSLGTTRKFIERL